MLTTPPGLMLCAQAAVWKIATASAARLRYMKTSMVGGGSTEYLIGQNPELNFGIRMLSNPAPNCSRCYDDRHYEPYPLSGLASCSGGSAVWTGPQLRPVDGHHAAGNRRDQSDFGLSIRSPDPGARRIGGGRRHCC